jgi:hypothetical protein
MNWHGILILVRQRSKEEEDADSWWGSSDCVFWILGA